MLESCCLRNFVTHTIPVLFHTIWCYSVPAPSPTVEEKWVDNWRLHLKFTVCLSTFNKRILFFINVSEVINSRLKDCISKACSVSAKSPVCFTFTYSMSLLPGFPQQEYILTNTAVHFCRKYAMKRMWLPVEHENNFLLPWHRKRGLIYLI